MSARANEAKARAWREILTAVIMVPEWCGQVDGEYVQQLCDPISVMEKDLPSCSWSARDVQLRTNPSCCPSLGVSGTWTHKKHTNKRRDSRHGRSVGFNRARHGVCQDDLLSFRSVSMVAGYKISWHSSHDLRRGLGIGPCLGYMAARDLPRYDRPLPSRSAWANSGSMPLCDGARGSRNWEGQWYASMTGVRLCRNV